MDEVDKTFKIFDVDGSEEIDREEALKHWKSSFGKLSAKEFLTRLILMAMARSLSKSSGNFGRLARGMVLQKKK